MGTLDAHVARSRPVEEPKVVAVVVGCDHAGWLDGCLGTLLAADHRALAVVYVDNGSRDGSLELVARRFPAVTRIALGRNAGFAAGCNRGIELAAGAAADFVFLVNPDTRTPATLVSRLVRFMVEHPRYGAVGPLQRTYSQSGGWSAELNRWSRHALENGERHVLHHWDPALPDEALPGADRAPEALDHAYVQGAALLLRASALAAAGRLDELYGSYYEEVDLCRRIRWAGYRVGLVLDAWIEHREGSGADHAARRYYMTRNRCLYALTDPTIPPRRLARLLARWLADDVRAQPPRVTAAAWGWLALHCREVARGRRARAASAARAGVGA